VHGAEPDRIGDGAGWELRLAGVFLEGAGELRRRAAQMSEGLELDTGQDAG